MRRPNLRICRLITFKMTFGNGPRHERNCCASLISVCVSLFGSWFASLICWSCPKRMVEKKWRFLLAKLVNVRFGAWNLSGFSYPEQLFQLPVQLDFRLLAVCFKREDYRQIDDVGFCRSNPVLNLPCLHSALPSTQSRSKRAQRCGRTVAITQVKLKKERKSKLKRCEKNWRMFVKWEILRDAKFVRWTKLVG